MKVRSQNHLYERVGELMTVAHFIRNRTSKQFKACKKLDSQRRWCLTGTPIQNCLDDLASLVSFLKIQPFESPTSFQKLILDPLEKDSLHRCRNIELLLRSLFLRRDVSHLSLPEIINVEEVVKFTQEERAAYGNIIDKSRLELEREVCKVDRSLSKYNVMFIAMNNLRRYCNSGTFKIGDANATECNTCVADMVVLLDNADTCPDCGNSLRGSSQASSVASPSTGNGFESPSRRDTLSGSRPEACNGYSSKLSRVVEKITGQAGSDKRQAHIRLLTRSLRFANDGNLALCFHIGLRRWTYWNSSCLELEYVLSESTERCRSRNGSEDWSISAKTKTSRSF